MNKDVDLIVRGYNTIINCMLSDSKNFFTPKKQDKTKVQRTQNRTDTKSDKKSFLEPVIISIDHIHISLSCPQNSDKC